VTKPLFYLYSNLLLNGYSPPVIRCSCGQRFTGTDAMWFPSPVCPDCRKEQKKNNTQIALV